MRALSKKSNLRLINYYLTAFNFCVQWCLISLLLDYAGRLLVFFDCVLKHVYLS